MNHHDSFFPLQTETCDASSTIFKNTIVGGVSMRDYFALEIFCALAANPALVAPGNTMDKLRGAAIQQAERLVADLTPATVSEISSARSESKSEENKES